MPAYKNRQALLFSPGWVLHKRLEKKEKKSTGFKFCGSNKVLSGGLQAKRLYPILLNNSIGVLQRIILSSRDSYKKPSFSRKRR